MFAVIKTGGKQYKVQVGQIIDVEKLDIDEGGQVLIDQVLLAAEGSAVSYGRPVIDGAVVTADVVSQHKGPKLTVFKYKSKSRYRRRTGHRQLLTQLSIQSIAVPGFETATAPVIEIDLAAPVEIEAFETEAPTVQTSTTAVVDEFVPAETDAAMAATLAPTTGAAGSAAPAGDALSIEGMHAQLEEVDGDPATHDVGVIDPATGTHTPPHEPV